MVPPRLSSLKRWHLTPTQAGFGSFCHCLSRPPSHTYRYADRPIPPYLYIPAFALSASCHRARFIGFHISMLWPQEEGFNYPEHVHMSESGDVLEIVWHLHKNRVLKSLVLSHTRGLKQSEIIKCFFSLCVCWIFHFFFPLSDIEFVWEKVKMHKTFMLTHTHTFVATLFR